MDYTIYPLRDIAPALLPALADLHQQTDHGLLSDLGYAFVLRYYEAALKDDRVVGFYARADSGSVIGYLIGSPTPAALTAQLTADKIWFLRNIMRVLFIHPLTFLQMAVSSLSVRTQMDDEENAIENVYYGVVESARGRGIGRDLLQALVASARAAGYKYIVASAETSNAASIAAMTASGFRIVKTFREGFYQRHRLRLTL